MVKMQDTQSSFSISCPLHTLT